MTERKPLDNASVETAGAVVPRGRPAAEGSPAGARPIGPQELKAFTHPLRMAMYTALRDHGPATASLLARRLGESSGQTSYHLRQLERHGFVEDDPDHIGGRERWWRPVRFSVDDPVLLADPEQAPAVRAMFDLVIADRVRVLRQFADAVMAGAPVDESAVTDSITGPMTLDESARMIVEVQRVLDEHIERAKARAATGDTAGRRRMRIYFDAVPLPDEPADEG
jgi:DNA-binding transcriptional ArsR family regulator